jgi:hypothetical protein
VNLAFRTLVKFGARDLYEFWKRSKPVGPGVLGFDEFGKYMSSSYYPIYYLVYHDQSLKEQEIFQYCLDSILLIELLDKKTDFFKSVAYEEFEGEVEEFKYFAASILVLHQMNFPCKLDIYLNYYGILYIFGYFRQCTFIELSSASS